MHPVLGVHDVVALVIPAAFAHSRIDRLEAALESDVLHSAVSRPLRRRGWPGGTRRAAVRWGRETTPPDPWRRPTRHRSATPRVRRANQMGASRHWRPAAASPRPRARRSPCGVQDRRRPKRRRRASAATSDRRAAGSPPGVASAPATSGTGEWGDRLGHACSTANWARPNANPGVVQFRRYTSESPTVTD